MEPSLAPTGVRPRFFYGWVIVGVSFVANAMSFGAGGASFSVFLRPMTESLGWSRTTLTGAVTVVTFANVFVAPIVGPLVDRYGPRAIMTFGALVAAVSYVLMSQISEPWHFYLLYTVAFALGLHEVGMLITTTVVAKWFVRLRGRAMAFQSLGNNVGGITVATLSAFLVGAVGWRSGWAILGVLIAAVVVPPTLLFMRRTPEDMGLRPDNDEFREITRDGVRRASHAPEVSWTARAALRTRTLWLVVIANNLAALANSFIGSQMIAYLADTGLSLERATGIYALYHFCAMFSKIGWGFIAERLPVRYCLMTNYLAGTVGFLVLLVGESEGRVYFWAVITGLFGTAFASLQPQLWADYYGRAFLGTIRGIITPFNLISSVCGPLLAAFMFDQTGTYTPVVWAFTLAMFGGALVMAAARPPKPQREAGVIAA